MASFVVVLKLECRSCGGLGNAAVRRPRWFRTGSEDATIVTPFVVVLKTRKTGEDVAGLGRKWR